MEYNLITKMNDQPTNTNMLKHNAEQIWNNKQNDMFHSMKLFFFFGGGVVCVPLILIFSGLAFLTERHFQAFLNFSFNIYNVWLSSNQQILELTWKKNETILPCLYN